MSNADMEAYARRSSQSPYFWLEQHLTMPRAELMERFRVSFFTKRAAARAAVGGVRFNG